MSQLQIGDIIAALPSMTPNERDQVQKHIKAFDSLCKRDVRAGGDGTYHWYLLIITEFLLANGYDGVSPQYLASKFANQPTYNAFAVKAELLAKFLNGLSRTQQQSLVTYGLKLLCDDLLARGMTPSAVLLIREFHRLQFLLSRQFPGYARAGLLHLIVRSSEAEKQKIIDDRA